MQLEYFQLLDRIVDLDLAARTIRTEARVPLTSTIFEGHFPGHPLMPGVLLIEAMAQTAGWLVIATTEFRRMIFLAAVKEAKFRSFVTPGFVLAVQAELVHEGSGYAMAAARITAALNRRGSTCAVVSVEPRRWVTATSSASQERALPRPALGPA